MSRLIISSPDGKRGILELGAKSLLTIGRGTANDLVLHHASVSRFHAVVKQLEGGAVVIADRGSTNGVLINGARIAGDAPLRNGDQIKVGVYDLKFEAVDEAALMVRKAQMPSPLDHVLKGGLEDLSLKHLHTPIGAAGELAGKVKKLERENYLLTVLYDAGKALRAKLSVDDVAEQVMSLSFRIEGVERGFMMLFNPQGEVWRQTEVRYRRPPASEQPQIILSRSILERVKTELQPILISDVSQDERFSGSESMKISGLRSAMCAPLVGGTSQLLGILYVDNLEKTSAFTEDELNVFALVAAQAAAAIDNALSHQQLAEQAVQRSALERFLSPDVVEMIAANPGNVRLGGSNQKVSVLFSDIRSFTALSENLPPEKVVEILNQFFTRVTDIIFDNGGTLDKYLGDGVMAVFGAPISKGNDAAAAVRAAIDIQCMLVELNRDAAARQWPQLKVGIGVSTGIATAGNIGSPRRLDYTVVGDTVNIAARLMGSASGGQILISQATANEAGPHFALQPLPPLMLKGKSEPVKVFSVPWGKAKAAGK